MLALWLMIIVLSSMMPPYICCPRGGVLQEKCVKTSVLQNYNTVWTLLSAADVGALTIIPFRKYYLSQSFVFFIFIFIFGVRALGGKKKVQAWESLKWCEKKLISYFLGKKLISSLLTPQQHKNTVVGGYSGKGLVLAFFSSILW